MMESIPVKQNRWNKITSGSGVLFAGWELQSIYKGYLLILEMGNELSCGHLETEYAKMSMPPEQLGLQV
jgi:hypothetical protein